MLSQQRLKLISQKMMSKILNRSPQLSSTKNNTTEKNNQSKSNNINITQINKKIKKTGNKDKLLKENNQKASSHLKEKANSISSEDINEGMRLFDQIQLQQMDEQKDIHMNHQKSSQRQLDQRESIIKPTQKKQKNINSKKVSFAQNLQQVEAFSFNPDRKWNQTLIDQRRGKFSPREYQILIKAIDSFARLNDMTIEEVIQTISQQNDQIKNQKSKKIWTNICSVLPNRSLRSTFKFLKRALHTNNHKGNWNKEDQQKLVELVEKYGRHWKSIGRMLNRTSQNVRDKFRQLGQENNQKIEGFWSISQLVTFLQALEKNSKINFLNQDICLEVQNEQKHNQIDKQQHTKKTYNSKNFIFHNLNTIQKYINRQNFNKIDVTKIEWSKLAEKIGTKSICQCRNKFVQLATIGFKHRSSIDFDQQILKFISNQKIELQNDIKWSIWNHQSLSAHQAFNRWKILKKHVQGRKIKNLKEILEDLKKIIQNRKKAYQD